MNANRLIFFCLLVLFFAACQSDTVDHNGALPHTSALPHKEMSAEDKAKMLRAKGKEVQLVNQYDVEQMFDAAASKLHIFSFWKLDCTACQTNIRHISKALEGINADNYRLVLINLDEKTQHEAVRAYVREHNIYAETYQLDNPTPNWMDGIHEDWRGELPATFLVKESEALHLKLQKVLDANECQALLNALTM